MVMVVVRVVLTIVIAGVFGLGQAYGYGVSSDGFFFLV